MKSVVAGVAAGAVAAIVAALVSLPLESPDDLLFNTTSVTIGALIVGALAGVAWWMLRDHSAQLGVFLGIVAAAFAVVAIAAFASEGLLDGMAMFVIPLAAIVLGIVAVLTPVLASVTLPENVSYGGAGAAAVAALVLGIAFAGQGDEESGRLSLPERAEATAAANGTPGTGDADPVAPSGVVEQADVAGVTFSVVPEESEATYTVREKLASLPASSDAVGRTRALSGSIVLDGTSELEVDLSTLASDQERRDNYIRENIFQTDPIATFVVDGLADLPDEYQDGEIVTRDVTGTMTIRGVARPLTFAVEARMEAGTLQLLGRTDFTWADFEIPPPNVGPIVQVEDNVHLEVLLIARPAG